MSDVSIEQIQYNEDDRAQRCLNVFPDVNGQINISYVNSTEHVVAWHKHDIQTDYWFCVKGSFKVGLAKDGIVEWKYLSDKTQEVLKIPPGFYHGYKALEPNSILAYYLTEKFNPDDEIRAKVGDFDECWQTENK